MQNNESPGGEDNGKYSPLFDSRHYHPHYKGTYECVTLYGKTVDEARAPAVHFRYWDGERWSLPIESDLDGMFHKPHADHYPIDPAEYLPFGFRGLVEDPDPL